MNNEKPVPTSFLGALIAAKNGGHTAIRRFLAKDAAEFNEQVARQRERQRILERELAKLERRP